MKNIPHIIHYCWFGKNPKSKEIEKCISSWKKFFPAWEIIEWNENNVDIQNECEYVKEAYAKKKYAFVSDYVRIKVLKEYGGVYFDTDLEIIKDCRKIYEGKKIVLGFQSDFDLLTAMIGIVPNHPMMVEFYNMYKVRKFINNNGKINETAINYYFNILASKYGVDISHNEIQIIDNDFVVYPSDYFCAFDVKKWHEVPTKNTYAIHHMASSWCSKKIKIKAKIIKNLVRVIGVKKYDILYSFYKGVIKL